VKFQDCAGVSFRYFALIVVLFHMARVLQSIISFLFLIFALDLDFMLCFKVGTNATKEAIR